MECDGNLVWSCSFSSYFFQKCLASNLYNSSHIVSIESMRDVISIYFALELKLNGLVEVVGFGRIALLNDNFDNKLTLKDFIGDNRNIGNFDLRYNWIYFFLIDKIDSRSDLICKSFDKQLKLVLLFPFYLLADDLAFIIFDADVDRPSFCIQKAYQSLQQNPFGSGVLYGQKVVFEFNEHTFERDCLSLLEVGMAAQTKVALH